MKEITGNIFEIPDADVICVTTNGIVKVNGDLVMGAGIALEFAKRFPDLPEALGTHVTYNGNIPYLWFDQFKQDQPCVVSFPTKEDWKDNSSLELIERSAKLLVKMANKYSQWKKVVLPRPGCALGGLKWEDVKKVLEPILDDRFYIITPGENKMKTNTNNQNITSFDGEYRWLSNFWPCKIRRYILTFDSVEAAYAASKCAKEGDRDQFVGITAAKAKKLGRQIEIREDWDQIKLQVMQECLAQKFAPGTELAQKLDATGDRELIEGNYWKDTFWGVCDGIGENHLGKLLMKQRELNRKMKTNNKPALDLHIWVDGACSGNPGPGGWAFYCPAIKSRPTPTYGYLPMTTNNQAELTSILEAIKAIDMEKVNQHYSSISVTIHTDSANCIGWLEKGWKRNVPEIDVLCKDIETLVTTKGITLAFEKTKGHASDPNNNLVDQYAVKAYTEVK